MSEEYKGQDPIVIAQQAERDLNSDAAKSGHRTDSDKTRGIHMNASDSTRESGVDESAAKQFAGGSVTYGSAASGAGNNRDIPLEEGGSINKETGQLHKAGDFEGPGGPEDKARMEAESNPGSDDVRSNIRN